MPVSKTKLINKEDIKEEMRLIKGSNTDYITPTSKIYKDYGGDMYYPKKNIINKYNGYVYSDITYVKENGEHYNRQRRVHIILAEAYIPNPDNKPMVMHLDNDTTNNSIDNLCWGTNSENVRQAIREGRKNAPKGYDSSLSKPIIMYDSLTGQELKRFGSMREATRKTIYKSRHIVNQIKNKPSFLKYPVYFRYEEDGNIDPPIIVVEYDYDTDIEIKRFYNVAEASRKTNIPHQTINQQCLKNKKPQQKNRNSYFLYKRAY